MTTKVYDPYGKLLSHSRNLRGLLEHARRVVPETVLCGSPDLDGSYPVRVGFADGSYAWTAFSDWRVAADWFATRATWPPLDTLPGHPGFAHRLDMRRLRQANPEFNRRFANRRFATPTPAPTPDNGDASK